MFHFRTVLEPFLFSLIEWRLAKQYTRQRGERRKCHRLYSDSIPIEMNISCCSAKGLHMSSYWVLIIELSLAPMLYFQQERWLGHGISRSPTNYLLYHHFHTLFKPISMPDLDTPYCLTGITTSTFSLNPPQLWKLIYRKRLEYDVIYERSNGSI